MEQMVDLLMIEIVDNRRQGQGVLCRMAPRSMGPRSMGATVNEATDNEDDGGPADDGHCQKWAPGMMGVV